VLDVTGLVSLNSDAGAGSELQIDLGFAAALGDSFVFIQNDGVDLIAGAFENLAQGEITSEEFAGNRYSLEIDYAAGDGNDVGLTVVDIEAVTIL
ncbi:MAG: hypothetical protein ABJ246_06685, partial [Paracoccaceae bacterium]